MLAPWKSWLTVDKVIRIERVNCAPTINAISVAKGHKILLLLQDRNEFAKEHKQEPSADWTEQHSIAKKLVARGFEVVVPTYPALGTLDNHLIREVSFFDFEFGGKNEWDGKPTEYGENCLRQLSSTHCRDFYPSWAINPVREKLPERTLKVLDIGCGPVSVLRWGAIYGNLSITGVDPLLDMYSLVLARHGLDALPKMRCDRELSIFGEELDAYVPDGEFDMVYTQNALDHTQQPARVLELMGKKLARHGRAVIQVAEREGTRQNWDQLHQTDIFLENGQLMYCHRDGVVRPLVTAESGLKLLCTHPAKVEWLACSLEKVA